MKVHMNKKIKSFWNNILLLQKPEGTPIYLSILEYIDFLNFVKGCYDQLLKIFKSTIFVMLNLFQHLGISASFETLKQVQGDRNRFFQQSRLVFGRCVFLSDFLNLKKGDYA